MKKINLLIFFSSVHPLLYKILLLPSLLISITILSIIQTGCASKSTSIPSIMDEKLSENKEPTIQEDPLNVISGDFADVLAQVQNKELFPEDPQEKLAKTLDSLPSNAERDGHSIISAIIIPGHHDLWRRQRIESFWIRLRLPEQKIVMHSILMKRKEGKWYDVVSTTDQLGGDILTFYFEVTESFSEPSEEKDK